MRTVIQPCRNHPGLCAAAILAWLSATSGAAPISSLVDDFDINVNSTSSTWSYGTVVPASNPFVMKLLDTNTKTMAGIFSSDTALPVWASTDPSNACWMLGKNSGASAIHNLWGDTLDFQPGTVMLYPGQDGRNLLVSWLAPSDRVIKANWTFTRISARKSGSQSPAGQGTDYRVTHRSGAVDTTLVGFAGVARPGGALHDRHSSSFSGLRVKAGDRVFWEIAGVGGTVDVDATGADIAIALDSSLSVSLTSPWDGQAFTNGSSISATATVVNGKGPYRVSFFTDTAGGGLVQAGSTQNGGGPTFTQELGAPAAGTYHVYATVTDSAGTPVIATSATNTFDVVTPLSGLALWYNQPAGRWLEALPVGNGRIGCMVFGGVESERLQLNEVSVWSGSPQDSDNPDALAALPEIRQLLFDGKYNQAKEVSAKKLICKGGGTRGAASANHPFGCFQTLGDLTLKFDTQGGASKYRRTLDLETAVATVSYRVGDATFKREVFSSAPDQALVVRMTCDKPGKIGFTAGLTRPERFATTADGSDGLVMRGQLNDGVNGTNGMRYIARVKAVAEGGTINTDGNNLRVAGANSVTLFLTAGTDHILNPPYRGNPHEKVTADQLAAVAAKPYEELRKAHVADYQKLFRRTSLDLGGHEARKLPTDQRLARMARDKTPDPDMEALFFQFGRYLAISSSRPGNLLSSLQGIWTESIQTPWCGQYTVDLNVQMNCWPLESANLSECFQPTFDLIDSWRVPGAKTAKVHYNAKGWIVHTVANVWGFTSAPEHPSFGMYMGVGAWLCQPVWEHYAFTGDREYLKRAYPVMKESAEFYLDWLVKHPKTGKLVSGPSTSPENEYIAADGQRGWLCMGPSMDQQQIWDLFGNVIEAAKELGIDEEFAARVRDARAQLAGPQIGSDGRLMEWPEEFKDSENGGHRHLSHLFGLHPGSQITPRGTPELAAAARKSLEVRLANGAGGCEWSSAWTINLFARLLDGEKAHEYILWHLNRMIAPNLFDIMSGNGPFQIDGNFGYAAGVCEMLLQSQERAEDGGSSFALQATADRQKSEVGRKGAEFVLSLLPALPKAWPSGSVKGLKARGGFEVDMTWEDGKVATLTIKSTLGKRCRIRSATPLKMAEGGLKPSLKSIDANVIEFDTKAGKTYSLAALPGNSKSNK